LVPPLSTEVLRTALPFTTGTLPRVLVPEVKETEPVGVPVLLVRAAVRVTAVPKTGFAGAKASFTLTLVLVTVCCRASDAALR
jgi:hypothetical protein